MTDRYSPMSSVPGRYAARIVWIVLQLAMAYTLASGFEPFFYQAF